MTTPGGEGREKLRNRPENAPKVQSLASPAGRARKAGEMDIGPLSHDCWEQWEPGAERRGTHTCDKVAGHPPPHHCPLCGSTWTAPGSEVIAPASPGIPAGPE